MSLKRSPELFNLDYAEDISRYIRFLATTTGRNAPDSLCIILFDITEKYSHVERALALQKNDFIPDITKYDTAYQNALKEIENYIINDNKSRKKDPEKKMTIEEYSDYLDNLQEKDRIKEDFRIEILEKYRARHPNNKRICKKLTKEYGDLAWFNLCKKRFKTAENYALKGISIDRLQRWLSGNLAIALLHQGKYEEAKKICLAFRNEQYTEDAGNAYYNNWISGFCGSLKKLEYEYNVKHADSEKLRREFKGNFWCDF